MTRPLLILLIVAVAILTGVQIVGKCRSKLALAPQGGLGTARAYAAATGQSFTGRQDIMADLRREIKALQAVAGDTPGSGPQAHVVRSLTLITDKLSEMDRRLRTLEQRAAREDHRQKMLEK